jgi:mannose-6-phosphate isomerase-like protein (cupin superfamily)
MKETSLGLVGLIGLVHEDARRAISEFNTEDWDFSIQQFKIKEKIPLGNHYHAKKDEIFVILKGSGQVTTQKREVPESRETFDLKTGSVVYVPKNMAHTFVLEPESEMICFSTKAFDKDDMYSLVLVK